MAPNRRTPSLRPVVICALLGCSESAGSPVADAGDASAPDAGVGSSDATTGISSEPGDASSGLGESAETSEGPPVIYDVGADDPDDPPQDECPCVGTGEGIYLVSDASQLFTFDPATLGFAHLGEIVCPTTGLPFAMAVDRDGHALVSYFVDTPPFAIETFSLALDDPSSCEPFALPLPEGRRLGGTGYASASAADPCDDLHLFSTDQGGEGTAAIGRVDRDSGAYVELGGVPYYQAQLTGTGDGRLFGFSGAGGDGREGSTASLVRFDIADAAVIEDQLLPALDADNGLGFAFWGGDVYFFTDGAHDTSIVTLLDYDESDGGGTTVVVDHTPVRIMGAGVSTCAPYVPTG